MQLHKTFRSHTNSEPFAKLFTVDFLELFTASLLNLIPLRTPVQTIEKIIEYCRIYPIDRFAFEKNPFQEIMLDNLTKRAQHAGVCFNTRPINSKANKQARIAGIETLVTQGLIVFSRHHQILLEQLRQFPLGKHDDGPDALEMAIQVARYKPGRVYVG